MPFMLERIKLSQDHLAVAQARGADAKHGIACAIQSILDARHSLRTVLDTMPPHDPNAAAISQVITALA
jgi:hypothetical protein